MSLHHTLAHRAIGYCRVSTEGQADHMLDQCEEVRKAAPQHGFEIVEIYEDVGSAHKKNAYDDLLGLQDAIRRARELDAVILVRDASRIELLPNSWTDCRRI